jgi:hypothetical protein
MGKLRKFVSCHIKKSYTNDHVGIRRNPVCSVARRGTLVFCFRWPNGGRKRLVQMPTSCNQPLAPVWLALAEVRADHPVLPVCDPPHNLPTCGMDRTFEQALELIPMHHR